MTYLLSAIDNIPTGSFVLQVVPEDASASKRMEACEGILVTSLLSPARLHSTGKTASSLKLDVCSANGSFSTIDGASIGQWDLIELMSDAQSWWYPSTSTSGAGHSLLKTIFSFSTLPSGPTQRPSARFRLLIRVPPQVTEINNRVQQPSSQHPKLTTSSQIANENVVGTITLVDEESPALSQQISGVRELIKNRLHFNDAYQRYSGPNASPPGSTPKSVLRTLASLYLGVPVFSNIANSKQHVYVSTGTVSSPQKTPCTVPLFATLIAASSKYTQVTNSSQTNEYFKCFVRSVTAGPNAKKAPNGAPSTGSSAPPPQLLVLTPKSKLSIPPPTTTTDHTSQINQPFGAGLGEQTFLDNLVSVMKAGPIAQIQAFIANAVMAEQAGPRPFDSLSLPKGLLLHGPAGCCKHDMVAAAVKRCSEFSSKTVGGFVVRDSFLKFSGVEVFDENEDVNHRTMNGNAQVTSTGQAGSRLLESAANSAEANWEVLMRLPSMSTTIETHRAPAVVVVVIAIENVDKVFPNDDDLITKTNLERLSKLSKALRKWQQPSANSMQNNATLVETKSETVFVVPIAIAFTGQHSGSKSSVNRIALSALFADGIMASAFHDLKSEISSQGNDRYVSPVGIIEVPLPTVTERSAILKETIVFELTSKVKHAGLAIGSSHESAKHIPVLPIGIVSLIGTISEVLARYLVATSVLAVIEVGGREALRIWERLQLSWFASQECATKTIHLKEQDILAVFSDHLRSISGSTGDSTSGNGANEETSSVSSRPFERAVNWKDIGGLEEVKESLINALIRPRQVPEAYLRMSITPPRGILLYGPPGCAKTTLVKALCSEGLYSFLYVDCASVLSSYVGESEQYLREVFAKARSQSPCIIFFDEVEAVSGKRDADGGAENDTAKLLSTLLIEMDGFSSSSSGVEHDVCFIGATNLPHRVDSALLRPGRFDLLIHVPLPTASERFGILRAILLKRYHQRENKQQVDSDHDAPTTIHQLERATDVRVLLTTLLPSTYETVMEMAAKAVDESSESEYEGEDVKKSQEAVTEIGGNEIPELDNGTIGNAIAKAIVTMIDIFFDGFSGADITSVVKEASTIAQRRFAKDLKEGQKSLSSVSPLPILTLADLQDAALNASATIYDSQSIEAFTACH